MAISCPPLEDPVGISTRKRPRTENIFLPYQPAAADASTPTVRILQLLYNPRRQDRQTPQTRMSTRRNPRRRVPRRPELAAVGDVALEHHPHVLALRAPARKYGLGGGVEVR